MVIFKIGSEDRPAAQADIKSFQKQLRKAMRKDRKSLRKGKSKCMRAIVCHHAVEVVIIPDSEVYGRDFRKKK